MAAPVVTVSASGEFQRPDSAFRNFVSREPGAQFPSEAGRYHLYISHACPWAHRAMVVRQLKGLQEIISVTSVHNHGGAPGWKFAVAGQERPEINIVRDPLHSGTKYLGDIYRAENPQYEGRFTVPLLYDKIAKKIVNNESQDIIRMMDREFDHLLKDAQKEVNLYPDDLAPVIDEANEWIYNGINNGVYKAGFAQSQKAYEDAVTKVFIALDRVEAKLCEGPFFFGHRMTETDVRLYTTLVRFDPVYNYHFKCNIRDIRSGYPVIHDWLRRMYWDVAACRDTTHFQIIKDNYTKDQTNINPFAITAMGPVPHILPKDEEVASAKRTSQGD
ncbi:hypothetical protein BFJ69_g15701 [Fusarium oxysporum]|uniref:GST N-terminal domain-containing protein n=1 Tax=Fusarium oxysporum TaxID=5507 RepID=A0A420MDJ0_FUSOX|nr:hypothetical protein BFJ69_g15701 [Fusarium oxysporum]